MQAGAWRVPKLVATPQPHVAEAASPAAELSSTCTGSVVITGQLHKLAYCFWIGQAATVCVLSCALIQATRI